MSIVASHSLQVTPCQNSIASYCSVSSTEQHRDYSRDVTTPPRATCVGVRATCKVSIQRVCPHCVELAQCGTSALNSPLVGAAHIDAHAHPRAYLLTYLHSRMLTPQTLPGLALDYDGFDDFIKGTRSTG